jgi:hypothetical protein
VVSSLQKLFNAIEKGSLDEQISCYGAFSNALYQAGGDLTEFVKTFIMEDQNFLVIKMLKKQKINESMNECLHAELEVLQQLATLTTPQILDHMSYDAFLPRWDAREIDLTAIWQDMCDHLSTRGFGVFARCRAFKVRDGRLVPVQNFDTQTLDQLYGYSRERNQVLENTRALAMGKPASNVLLYGDAGTGKSSTSDWWNLKNPSCPRFRKSLNSLPITR